MANLTIPEVPQFEEEIEKLTPQTPAHANAFNAIHEKLFYNTLFLKAKNAILETDIARAIAIALGRNQALVFNTYDEMVAWFDNADNADKKAALSNGTNLYIIDKDVPDYWWSSVNQQYYQLETQKADLTKYDNLLGTNDISGLSEDGTVTGALVQQKENLEEVNTNLSTLTDSGNIEFFSVGADGSPYITYKAGADTVTKKLGSMVSFGIISLAYKAGTKSFTINTRGKQMLHYAAGLGSHSNISVTTGAEKINVSNDSAYLKSSDFVKKIIDGIPLPHSIDVSSLNEIIITCTSYTGNNENCDFIFSFDSASAKLEGDYLLYGA